MLNVISDILDISKIEIGAVELDEQTFELEQCVAECMSMVRERADNSGLNLSMDIDLGGRGIFADELRIKQILLNLLSNAIKFTPPNGDISVAGQIDENGDMRLCVRDTGIGIATDKFDTVLEPFGQVRTNSSLPHEGTGLGLPLAKSLVEIHGGSLDIESTVTKGTAVTMRSPAARITEAH